MAMRSKSDFIKPLLLLYTFKLEMGAFKQPFEMSIDKISNNILKIWNNSLFPNIPYFLWITIYLICLCDKDFCFWILLGNVWALDLPIILSEKFATFFWISSIFSPHSSIIISISIFYFSFQSSFPKTSVTDQEDSKNRVGIHHRSNKIKVCNNSFAFYF